MAYVLRQMNEQGFYIPVGVVSDEDVAIRWTQDDYDEERDYLIFVLDELPE